MRYDAIIKGILEGTTDDVQSEGLSNAWKSAVLGGALAAGGMAGINTNGGDAIKTNPAIERQYKQSASNISEAGKKHLKKWEELRLKPYSDKTGETITEWNPNATIGWGHLISKNEWSKFRNGIDETTAEAVFNDDISWAINTVRDNVKTPLLQNQFDALVSLTFNIGRKGFVESSVLKLLNGEEGSNYPDLESAWKAWNKDDGKVSRGLVNRRNMEWDVFYGK